MNTIDLYRLVCEDKLTPEDAIEKCQKLGMDHVELAVLLDVVLPGEVPEAEQPLTHRVTAKAREFALPDGKKLEWLHAGRHRWTRVPTEESTHDLCATQYRDVKRHEALGSLIIKQEIEIL